MFLFAALLSCKEDFTTINKRKMIPREKFVEMLTDIHMVDVLTVGPAFTRKYQPDDSLDIYGSVFKKYNVTKADFDSTVAMYIRQPEIYLKVYDEVLLKLNYMLDTLRDTKPVFTKEDIERQIE